MEANAYYLHNLDQNMIEFNTWKQTFSHYRKTLKIGMSLSRLTKRITSLENIKTKTKPTSLRT